MKLAAALALALLVSGSTVAGAKGKHHRVAKASHGKAAARANENEHERTRTQSTQTKRRIAALAKRPQMPHFQGPVAGQSLGYPWSGRLQDASELPEGEGYVIRRPSRAFGTAPAIDIIHRVLTDIVAEFPENHVLGIGDISAEHGGAITQHASHQAGRDVDIGLYYNEKPASYPEEFIDATEANLDAEATYALVDKFAKTAKEDGGVMMMFLDYNVQGILYRWAKDHGIDDDHLERLLQYPRGKGADALVRHYPNHANHFHVRFKCPSDDDGCR